MTGIDAQFNQIAGNFVLRDPRTKAIADKILQMMGVRGGIASLDPTTSSMLSVAISALNNSGYGQFLGIQNGADVFSNIHQGVLAGGSMPVNLSAGFTSNGLSSGMSSRSMAVASQLTNTLNAFATNPNGGMNLSNTSGLQTGTLSQMAASYMMRRGFSSGDIYEMNLGGSGRQAMDALRKASREQGINMQDADVVAMQKIAVTNEARRKMLAQYAGVDTYEEYQKRASEMDDAQRIAMEQSVDSALLRGGGKKELSEAAKSLGVSVGDIDVSEGMIAGARQMDQNTLQGTFATRKLTDDLQKTLKTTSANVARLGKIFQTQDFQQLQSVSDSLRLGSLVDKDNVDKVKRSLDDAQAVALQQGRTIQDVLTEQGDIVESLAQVSGGKQRVNRQSVEAIQRRTGTYEQNNRAGYDTRTKEEFVAEQTALELNAQQQFGGIAVLEQVLRDNPGLKSQYGDAWNSILRDFESGDLDKMRNASIKAQSLAQSITPMAREESFKASAYAKSQINYNERALRAQGARNRETRMSQFFSGETEQSGLFYNLTGAGAGENRMSHEQASQLFASLVDEFGGDIGAAEDFFNELQKGGYSTEGLTQEQIERRAAIASSFNKASSSGQAAIRTAMRTLQMTKGISGQTSVSQQVDLARRKDEATIDEALDLSTKLGDNPIDKFLAGFLMDGGLTDRQALFARATEGWTDTDAAGNKIRKSAYDAATKSYNYRGLAEGGMTRLRVSWKDGKGTLDTGGLSGQELEDFYSNVQNILGVGSREELDELLSDENAYRGALAEALRNTELTGVGDTQGGMIFSKRSVAEASQKEYAQKGKAIDSALRTALKGMDVGGIDIGDDGKLKELTIGDTTYKGKGITVGVAKALKGNRANIEELKKIADDPNNPDAKRAQEILTEVTYQNVIGLNDVLSGTQDDEELAKLGIGSYDDEGNLEKGRKQIKKAQAFEEGFLSTEKGYTKEIINKLRNEEGILDANKAYELRNAKGPEGDAARDLLKYRADTNLFTGNWAEDKKNFDIDESGYIRNRKSGRFVNQNIYDTNTAAGKAFAEVYNKGEHSTQNIEQMLRAFMPCVVGNKLRITED